MNQNEITEGKTLAVVSYFTFIGLIIAMIMNLEKKNAFVHFHCRQMLGLILMLIFSNVCEKYVNSYLGTTFWVITFVFWIMGLVYAIRGEYKTIPFLGDTFQKWFKNLQ